MRGAVQTTTRGAQSPKPGLSAEAPLTTGGVVFIAGLTHSGSTLLDFILAGTEDCVGLGEVGALVNPASRKLWEADRLCSCGSLVGDCVYWGELRRRLEDDPSGNWADRYLLAYQVGREVFGERAVLVDSSKSLSSLRTVAHISGGELRAIHLVRDVRSWTISRLDVDRRRRLYTFSDLYARYGKGSLRLFLLRGPIARFHVWYRGNRRIAEYLRQSEIESLPLSYEELAIDFPASLSKLTRFLGKQWGGETGAGASSHIALGNRMRLDQTRRRQIRYDARWMTRREWVLPSLLFPRIMAYNNEMTFGALGKPR